jgi:hypothetical protein
VEAAAPLQAQAEYWLAAPLAWHAMDGSWLVFQAADGLVSEIDDLGGLVLSLVEQQPATTAELLGRLAALAGDDWSTAAASRADEAITALQRVGLLDVRPRLRAVDTTLNTSTPSAVPCG